MIVTDLSIREGARCKRRLDSVYRGEGGYGGCRARSTLLLCAPHLDRIPGISQRTSSAPHPPQGGRCGDTAGSLPVKLEERCNQAIVVHQGRMSQLGVCPCEIYVHYDRAAGLTLLVLTGPQIRLCLRVHHTCGDNFIFNPFNVTPVQLLVNVLAFILQNNVLQCRHFNHKVIVVAAKIRKRVVQWSWLLCLFWVKVR